MARRGRKRKSTARREPNGQVSRADFGGPVVLVECLEQRRAMVAALSEGGFCMPVQTMTDARGGTALGMLRLAARIDERDYQAGEQLQSLWFAWSSMCGCPPRTVIRPGDHAGSDYVEDDMLTPEQWNERRERWVATRNRFEGIRARIVSGNPALGAMAMSLLCEVLMENRIPDRLLGNRPLVWAALGHGFREAAVFFHVPEAEAKRRTPADSKKTAVSSS